MSRKRLTSVMTAASLVASMAPVAGAATGAQQEAGVRMNQLGVVQGVGVLPNGQPNLNLDGPITRAELVTTIVRSFGLESAAQLGQSLSSFPDVPGGMWYSGYVAVANNLAQSKGIAIGRQDGTFDPNASVTKAEALVFVLKFLGLNAPASTGLNWYDSWLDLAVAQGVMTPAQRGEFLQNAGAPATRGEAFVLLDLSYSAKVLEGGKSLYTQYVDGVAPAISLVTPPSTTTNTSITLTGSVSDNRGIAKLTMAGNPITLSNGGFSVEVPLVAGPNTIAIEVTDLAGNSQQQSVVITRAGAQPASIEATDITVGAGQSVSVGVVKDSNGIVISNAGLMGASTVGTYANGTFTAGTTLGTGTLTLHVGTITKEIHVNVVAGPVAKVVSTSMGPGTSVKLQATDAFGNVVTGATWNLATGQSGAVLTPDGTFTGLVAGTYPVVATVNGVSALGQVGVFGMVTSLHVEAPTTVVGNDLTTYTVKVSAVDSSGIVNTSFAELISLTTPFGTFTPTAAENGVVTFTFSASDLFIGEELNIKATATLNSNSLEGSTKVRVVAQVPTAVKVEPAAAFLTSNATSNLLDVTVMVVDQDGAPMLDGDFNMQVNVLGPATFDDGTTLQRFNWSPYANYVKIKPTEVGVTGTVTVLASVGGLQDGRAEVTARMAGSAKQIVLKADETKMAAQSGLGAVSDALYFKASLTDAAGVPVTPDDKDLKLVFSGIPTDELGQHYIAYDVNMNGVLDGVELFAPIDVAVLTHTAVTDGKLAFWLVGEKAGNYGVKVTDVTAIPTLTASTEAAYTITAGKAHHFEGLQPQGLIVRRGDATQLKYQAVDSFGNPVAMPNLSLVFDATGTSGLKLNGQTTAVTVKTDDAGVATVSVVADSVIDNYGGAPVSINPAATNTANGWSGTAMEWDTAINALILAPGSVEMELQVDKGAGWVPLVGQLEAGTSVRVVATVKDTQGYPLAGVGTTIPVQLVVKSTGTTQTNLSTVTFSDSNDDGVYESSPIMITKAGSQALKVEISNLPQVIASNSRTVTVRAGALAGVKLQEATSNNQIKLKADQPKELTIILVDSYGNQVASSAVTHPVLFTFGHSAGGTSYTSFRDQDGNELISDGIQVGAGRSSAKFFLRTNNVTSNTISIYATVDDDNSGTFGGGDLLFSATYSLIAE